jgi:type II secretory pathway component PulM
LTDLVVIFIVLALVVVLVSAPLRARRAGEAAEDAELAELEAARDAKYREIRDAELDHHTGKLSDADWRALDRTLRAEAVAILRRLDELDPPTSGAGERSYVHETSDRRRRDSE